MRWYNRSMEDKTYKEANSIFGDNQILFMNHGFCPVSEDIQDLEFKHQVELYNQAIKEIDLDGKVVLEIGCGRGGGSKWISSKYNVSTYHACDISEENINFCNKTNTNNNLIYSVMDSQSLEYPEDFFDLVICVESSHNYKNMELFFENVRRVLKKTGQLVLLDNYVLGEKAIENQLMSIDSVKGSAVGFTVLEYVDITENVKASCKEDIELIDNWVSDINAAETLKSISSGSYKRYENNRWGYFKFKFGMIDL